MPPESTDRVCAVRSSSVHTGTLPWPACRSAWHGGLTLVGSSPPGSSTLSVWSPQSAARRGAAAARASSSVSANTITRAGGASGPALHARRADS